MCCLILENWYKARKYSSLQLNEVQNQGFTNQIILLAPAWLLSVVETLPSASCLKTSDFVL
ncbi:MAG: hypothetical protein RM338_29145, partial [Nostoc sp. DedQUE12a]|nr:hypothetical protein [Nostoc sp. DedQUE12a]